MTGGDVYSVVPVTEPISSAEVAERVRNRWAYVYPENPEHLLALVRSHLGRLRRAGRVEMLRGEDGPAWRRTPYRYEPHTRLPEIRWRNRTPEDP